MFIISNADPYRGRVSNGVVINELTGEPRLFVAREQAKRYAELSLFRGGYVIKAHA